jgi:hypothetical protein
MRLVLAIAMVTGSACAAIASDTGPVIVIPGRAGLPVVINGRDASFAVVEGDWGLAQNVHVQPTVFGGRDIFQGPEVGHYYPSSGQIPGYGRVEIEPSPNRALPQPPESFYRSWSVQSAPAAAVVPLDPPPVIGPDGQGQQQSNPKSGHRFQKRMLQRETTARPQT